VRESTQHGNARITINGCKLAIKQYNADYRTSVDGALPYY